MSSLALTELRPQAFLHACSDTPLPGRHQGFTIAGHTFHIETTLTNGEPARVRSEVFHTGRLLRVFEQELEASELPNGHRTIDRMQRKAEDFVRQKLADRFQRPQAVDSAEAIGNSKSEALAVLSNTHTPSTDNSERLIMQNVTETLQTISEINGYVGSCIVDGETGMMLAADGGDRFNLEVAAAGNTEVVRAKRATMRSLDLGEEIEDMLITLDSQYHLIRPLASNGSLFIYLVISKAKANLAMARHVLSNAEKELVVA